MKLKVSEEAAQWYIDELLLEQDQSIKFFGKVYGPHDGFSIALDVAEPSKTLAEINVKGINFYIDANDAWFFDNYDLDIGFDEKLKEPQYNLIKI